MFPKSDPSNRGNLAEWLGNVTYIGVTGETVKEASGIAHLLKNDETLPSLFFVLCGFQVLTTEEQSVTERKGQCGALDIVTAVETRSKQSLVGRVRIDDKMERVLTEALLDEA